MKVAVIVLALVGLMVLPVAAQGAYPDGVEVFSIPGGQTCVLWPDGSGECFCPCETGLCAVEYVATPAITSEPRPTATKDATAEPTPEPTEKPRCNKGGGNGSEGCDPGNNPDNGNDDEG